MHDLYLTDDEARTLRRAINMAIKQQLRGLAAARFRVKAALDLGSKPDHRDVGGVEFCESEVANLRNIKDALGEEETDK